MEYKKTAHIVGLLLIAASLIILVNNFLYNPLVWIVADVLYLLIALLFCCTLARSSGYAKVIAVLLWVPVAILAYVALSKGILAFFAESEVWLAMNMYQLLLYGYVIGHFTSPRD